MLFASSISDSDGTVLDVASTPGLLTCGDKSQYVWVRWTSGLLEVGAGSVVGQGRFLHWDSTNQFINVTAIGLGTGPDEILYHIWQQQGWLFLL